MRKKSTIVDHERLALEKLTEAKLSAKVFAMDYDGTLTDGKEFEREHAIGLIKEILKKKKTPAFMTARAASAVKAFVPPLEEHYQQYPDSVATYIGGGNGAVLYKVSAKGIERMYNHGLSLEEIKKIVGEWEHYAQRSLPPEDLSEKGLQTFKKFNAEIWDGLISDEILAIGKAFEGRIFTEEAKVTFVLPKDEGVHKKVVEKIQGLIGNNFSVAAGDKDFCHITKRLHEDSKMVAVKTILTQLHVTENNVVTFGDMPHGNDKGLLSFPYSFTNYSKIASQKKLKGPPFILPGKGLLPVARVYKAIHYLLS